MKHTTPGPWKVTKHATKYPDLFTYSIIQAQPDPDFNTVCGITSELDSETDAEFICRACNSHEDLLEACKYAFENLRPQGNIKKDFSGHNAMATLSRAITQAEGR